MTARSSVLAYLGDFCYTSCLLFVRRTFLAQYCRVTFSAVVVDGRLLSYRADRHMLPAHNRSSPTGIHAACSTNKEQAEPTYEKFLAPRTVKYARLKKEAVHETTIGAKHVQAVGERVQLPNRPSTTETKRHPTHTPFVPLSHSSFLFVLFGHRLFAFARARTQPYVPGRQHEGF